jgi:hypothetical protein
VVGTSVIVAFIVTAVAAFVVDRKKRRLADQL